MPLNWPYWWYQREIAATLLLRRIHSTSTRRCACDAMRNGVLHRLDRGSNQAATMYSMPRTWACVGSRLPSRLFQHPGFTRRVFHFAIDKGKAKAKQVELNNSMTNVTCAHAAAGGVGALRGQGSLCKGKLSCGVMGRQGTTDLGEAGGLVDPKDPLNPNMRRSLHIPLQNFTGGKFFRNPRRMQGG